MAKRLNSALADGWHLRAESMEYVPEGGGSYHWKLTGEDGQPHFVTVDDLDGKDWLGDTRAGVFEGIRRALSTATALRYEAGLGFVVAPSGNQDTDRYQQATGRELDPAVITLYRLRWYLDDLASAIRLFRRHHRDTPDTRRWWHGLAPRLELLPGWIDLLG